MAYGDARSTRDRSVAGAATLVCVAVVGWGLLTGWRAPQSGQRSPSISAIAITAAAPEPTPEPAPRRAAAPREAGAAAPPNRRARPREIVAPPMVSPPIVDVPPAAPVAGTGPDASAGAAVLTGPGTGAGGIATGLGSGGAGDGTGGGGGGSPARWRSGSIRNRDYPREASRANAGGTVDVRLTVAPTGRVTACTVMRSSGIASLDAVTCRLAITRFRFTPARNAAGDAITADTGWRQRWWLDGRRAD